jgi:serine/threonine protein kinase
MSLEGQQIDRYRILRLLGSGGMGDVYLAEDARIEQQVAIKVIRTEFSPYPGTEVSKEAIRLFQREAKAIAKLDHPNILPLFDYGEERLGDMTLIYLVMPYRQEGSLMKWLRQRNQAELLSPLEVTHIIRQAADALQHAHNRQVVHQDVKPYNFLLRHREAAAALPDILLADFGIATLSTGTASASQVVRGTPTYMAPEQCMGHSVPASDQYALAVMAYELLTGRPPFRGGTVQMMYQHMHEQPQSPSTLDPRLSREMDTVILTAMAKRPEQRFASVSAFANAFQHAVQGMQTADAPTLVTSPPMPSSTSEMRAILAISTVEAQAGTHRTLTLPGGRRVTVPVPAGVRDGHVLRLDGQGEPTMDGSAGTLILTIMVKQEEAAPSLSNSLIAEKTFLTSNATGPISDAPIVSVPASQTVREVDPALVQTPVTPVILPAPIVGAPVAQSTVREVDPALVQSPITPVIPSNPSIEYTEPAQSGTMHTEVTRNATEVAGAVDTAATVGGTLTSPTYVISPQTPSGMSSPVTSPPGMLPPATPHPGGPRRNGGARRWVVMAAALFVVLLITVGGVAFADPGLFGFSAHAPLKVAPAPGTTVTPTTAPVAPGSAVVMITPAQKSFNQSYTITEVTGNPDPTQNQVQGVRILSSTQSQSSQATATGSGQTAATNASGTLTLSQPSQAVTIPAGTEFTSSSGVTVATRSSVSLSLGSSQQVGAYAVQAGSAGNIAAYSINATATYNGVNYYVQNTAAFSGGQSGQSYPVLLQSDINAAAQAISGQVTQAAQNGLSPQLQANEQLIGNASCTSQTTSTYPAGSQVSSATVTVSVTCQVEAYNPQPALTMASNLFKQDIPKKLGANYALVGNVQTTSGQPSAGNGTVTITISEQAQAVYQFSTAQLQSIARQIAGESQQDAQALLSRQPGVLKVTITLSSGGGNTVPADAKNITIKVVKVQS